MTNTPSNNLPDQPRTTRGKKAFLEQLKKTPIIQVACEKVFISRPTIYRWKSADPEFSRAFDEAIHEGRLLVNDVAESQLMAAIRERNMTAVMYWLRHNHPNYATSVQVTHKLEDVDLTPEQEALVRQALALAYGHRSEEILSLNPNSNE